MKLFIAILLLSSLGYANTFENIPSYQFHEHKDAKDLTTDTQAQLLKKCQKAIQEKKEIVVSMGYTIVEESACSFYTAGHQVYTGYGSLTVLGKIKFLK